MITIICGGQKVGKTKLLVHMLNQVCWDWERYDNMCDEIREKNAGGFNDGNLSIPEHCCFSSFDIRFCKFGFTDRKNYTIDPFRLGYANEQVKVHFIPPYSCIGVPEAQEFWDSKGNDLFWWQSRWFEQSTHNHIDIILDAHRPELINKNIRDIAVIIEIQGDSNEQRYLFDKNGNEIGYKLRLRKIGIKEWEHYASLSPEEKERQYPTYGEVISGNGISIDEMYDCRNCKPRHYDGHWQSDFDLKQHPFPVPTVEGYKKYVEDHFTVDHEKYTKKRSR